MYRVIHKVVEYRLLTRMYRADGVDGPQEMERK